MCAMWVLMVLTETKQRLASSRFVNTRRKVREDLQLPLGEGFRQHGARGVDRSARTSADASLNAASGPVTCREPSGSADRLRGRRRPVRAPRRPAARRRARGARSRGSHRRCEACQQQVVLHDRQRRGRRHQVVQEVARRRAPWTSPAVRHAPARANSTEGAGTAPLGSRCRRAVPAPDRRERPTGGEQRVADPRWGADCAAWLDARRRPSAGRRRSARAARAPGIEGCEHGREVRVGDGGVRQHARIPRGLERIAQQQSAMAVRPSHASTRRGRSARSRVRRPRIPPCRAP